MVLAENTLICSAAAQLTALKLSIRHHLFSYNSQYHSLSPSSLSISADDWCCNQDAALNQNTLRHLTFFADYQTTSRNTSSPHLLFRYNIQRLALGYLPAHLTPSIPFIQHPVKHQASAESSANYLPLPRSFTTSSISHPHSHLTLLQQNLHHVLRRRLHVLPGQSQRRSEHRPRHAARD